MGILLAGKLRHFNGCGGMDATGRQGCKVKNLRKRRFVSSSKAGRGQLDDSSQCSIITKL
jgi:hypothetical protein